MTNESNTLAELVLDEIVFFAVCDDEICEQRTAIKMLESISYTLKKDATPNERRTLLAIAQNRLKSETSAEIRDVLLNLKESIGLLTD